MRAGNRVGTAAEVIMAVPAPAGPRQWLAV